MYTLYPYICPPPLIPFVKEILTPVFLRMSEEVFLRRSKKAPGAGGNQSFCTTLDITTLHYTTLRFTTLYYTTLRLTTLNCTTRQLTTLH